MGLTLRIGPIRLSDWTWACFRILPNFFGSPKRRGGGQILSSDSLLRVQCWVWMTPLSDYADVCYTHVSRAFQRLNMLPVSHSKTFCALDLMMEVAQIREDDGTFQVYCQYIYKTLKENFGVRPKSVRRTLVLGLIYGSRANKQFDIAF